MSTPAENYERKVKHDHKNQCSFENCEFIIASFEDDQLKPADSKLLHEVYKIVSMFSFPTNTNPLTANDLKALSQSEWEELDSNEYNFILKKIREINKNLIIIPIPKSLYQFYYLTTQLTEMFKFPETRTSHMNSTTESVPGRFAPFFKHDKEGIFREAKPEDNPVDMYQNCLNYRNNIEVCKAYIRINQDFTLEWIKKFGIKKPVVSYLLLITLSNSFFCAFKKLISEAYKNDSGPKFVQSYFDRIHTWTIAFKKQPLSQLTQLFLQTLICHEWSLRTHQGSYILYRGGYLDIDTNKHCSRSYSDGLFGGALYDQDSGMAFAYCSPSYERDHQLIALSINKREYRLKKQLGNGNAIFIPPLHNIGIVSGIGEHHHPKTTLASDFSYKDSFRTNGCITIYLKGNEHLLACLPKSQHYVSVKSFLNDNHHIIKPRDLYYMLVNGITPGQIEHRLIPVPTKPRSYDDCFNPKPFVLLFDSVKRKEEPNKKQSLLFAKDDIELYKDKTARKLEKYHKWYLVDEFLRNHSSAQKKS